MNAAEEAIAEAVEEYTECAEECIETAAQKMARKCCEAKNACCGSIARIARDLKETNYNPYIKQTRTYQVEIYRNCNDEEPVDSYETTDVKSFSACALALATATAVAE